MNDGAFQWDEAKAAKNYAKHGITFEAARGVFKDPFAIEHIDDCEDYGEDRFIIIGMVNGRVLAVVYTLRDKIIRIISARGAEPYEQRQYYEQNT